MGKRKQISAALSQELAMAHAVHRKKKKSPVPGSPEDDLRDWYRVWVELSEGTITLEEYDEWSIAISG